MTEIIIHSLYEAVELVDVANKRLCFVYFCGLKTIIEIQIVLYSFKQKINGVLTIQGSTKIHIKPSIKK